MISLLHVIAVPRESVMNIVSFRDGIRLISILICLLFLFSAFTLASSVASDMHGEVRALKLALAIYIQDSPDITPLQFTDGNHSLSADKMRGVLEGQYAKTDMLIDAWGTPHKLLAARPSNLKEKGDATDNIFVYSVGANGKDEGGDGDDIASWKAYDAWMYEKSEQFGIVLRWGAACILSTFLGCGLLLWRRRQHGRKTMWLFGGLVFCAVAVFAAIRGLGEWFVR